MEEVASVWAEVVELRAKIWGVCAIAILRSAYLVYEDVYVYTDLFLDFDKRNRAKKRGGLRYPFFYCGGMISPGVCVPHSRMSLESVAAISFNASSVK